MLLCKLFSDSIRRDMVRVGSLIRYSPEELKEIKKAVDAVTESKTPDEYWEKRKGS